MMKKKASEVSEIVIQEVQRGEVRYCLLGTTPLIPRLFSEEAKQQLLFPPKRKGRAERDLTLKHDPHKEFQSSALLLRDDESPSLIGMPGGSFKKAMASATTDTGGSSRAQIGRLTYIGPYNVAVYGEPRMLMSVVRMADMSRTPDVRTRVIIEHWCCELTVSYARPMLNERVVTRLLANAGIYIGVGDWRQEKGSGSHGLWQLVEEDNRSFLAIKSKWARSAQIDAMKEERPYDAETENLLTWFDGERTRRSDENAPKAAKKGGKG